MDQSINITKKVQDRIRKQRASDRALKLFLVTFIAGNIFFFASPYLLPTVTKDVTPTPVGTVIEIGDEIITLDAWGYSEKDRAFEILLEVESLSLDDSEKLDFSCKCGTDFYPVTVDKVINDNLYVLIVKKVSRRFTDASLTIEAAKGDEEAYEKIYATDESVSDISTAVSDNDYLIFAANSKIKGYKTQIRTLKRKQADLDEQLVNSVQMISDLEEKKKLQTDTEIEETDSAISKISSDAEGIQAELEEVTLEIQDLQEKIKNQKTIIRTLEGGGDA